MSGPVPGFEVALHRSLAEPILLAGVPRPLAILNGTFSAALGLGLQQWAAGLGVWAAAQAAGALLARRDPAFAEVLARHLRHRSHYGC